jgi:hypothetical protein
MWPLGFVLLFGMAAQQKPLDAPQGFLRLKPAVIQQGQHHYALERKSNDESLPKLCFTMRSYFFRRQDGQAPVPAGMTTCTPARILQQQQISPAPDVKFVPLGARSDER